MDEDAVEDVAEAAYEGHWSRLTCPWCEDTFDVEGDVSSGDPVTCDACEKDSVVAGR